MNIQAMMKQAQALQKDMTKAKEEIDNTEFVGESSIVKVTVMGTKMIKDVKITGDIDTDDIEMLQDMIMIAVNNANKSVDEATEKMMGKFGSIPGLF